jgi:NAD(P)-dependent dehydrogenase (short-subunit alcohol dehydrogenase family)
MEARMNKPICVITGAGSGMGLAVARIMGTDHSLILVGRTVAKLESAVAGLRKEGIDAEAFACDVADRDSTFRLAGHAKARGRVAAVIHAAGLSPHMADARTVMAANALGTVNVNDAFFGVLNEGACIVDVSSMSAYMIPGLVIPKGAYGLSRTDRDRFMKKMMARVGLFPAGIRSSVAYGISKNFAVWYAKSVAARFGERGVRVVSVSPGNFETPMGELERKEASAYTERCAIKRFGKVEEIANLLAFCASDKAGYLTGTDILCDGGCVAGGRARK